MEYIRFPFQGERARGRTLLILQEGGTIYLVRQQTAITRLVDGRFQTIVLPVKTAIVTDYLKARSLVYQTYADLPDQVAGHYAVISEGNRYRATIRIGTALDGFKIAT